MASRKRRRAACCTVDKLAAEYARLEVIENELMEPGDAVGRQENAVSDRKHAIRDAVSWMTATNAAGAAFQVVLVSADLSMARDADGGAEEDRRRAGRLLYRVVEFLGSQGARVDNTVVASHMPPSWDPRRLIDAGTER